MKNLQIQMVILLALLLAYYVRFNTLYLDTNYIIALLGGLLTAAVVMPATGAFRHEFRWAFLRKIRRLLAGWALVVTILVTLAALFKVSAEFSRIWFGYWVLFTGASLILSQIIEHGWQIHRKNHLKAFRRVVLVGGGQHGLSVKNRITTDPDGALQLIAFFGTDWSGENSYPVAQLGSFIQNNDIEEVWVAAPGDEQNLLKVALRSLNELVVDVIVVPDLHQYRLLNQKMIEWDGLPVISLSGTPMSGTEQRLKSIFDRLGSLVLITILSPVFLILMILVRLSGSGPIFFRQKRAGTGGEAINILKFRSMSEHSGGFSQATAADNRVTPIGRILRKTSLDELPQLFNVLKGEMSLVGPRPHPIELNEQFMSRIPRYMLRHKVKPGITGWAQVNGYRGITDTDDKMALRIEYDLWYIQNWSLWLDLKILMQTPLAMIHQNAF